MVNGNGSHPENHPVLDTENWNAGEKGSATASPFQPHIARDHLEEIIRALLIEIGVDVNSEHFCDTPARVARFYREFTAGYGVQAVEHLKDFSFYIEGFGHRVARGFFLPLSTPFAFVQWRTPFRLRPG